MPEKTIKYSLSKEGRAILGWDRFSWICWGSLSLLLTPTSIVEDLSPCYLPHVNVS